MTHPYVGLRAFNRDESAIFFGREAHTDALLDALARQQFLAVVGLSGSGKSSLVKCGLIPALESGYLSGAGTHWCIADFRPGNDPFKHLAASLGEAFQTIAEPDDLTQRLRNGGAFSLHEYLAAHPLPKSGKLLLICDQFEELFRYSEQHASAEAAAFVALLLAGSRAHTLADGQTSNGIYLVLTMRSDFLGECAQFVGLAEAINQGLYLTPRLNREQLRLAIEEPALIADGEADPALVVQLLEDVGNNPDQLPLLQHVLMRLWDDGQNLTLAHYQALGGLTAALDRHAEQALAELNPSQQKIAEIVFRALTERNSEGKDTRRPVSVAALLDSCQTDLATLKDALAPFRQAGRNFLMPPPAVELTLESVLDISHESLIRQWQRLQAWVKAETDSAVTYARLLDAAVHHRELWRGTDLTLALEWEALAQPHAAWAARYGTQADFAHAIDFLQRSDAEAKRLAQALLDLEQEVEAQRKAELKRTRRRMVLSLIGLLIALGLAGWAFKAENTARKSQILTVEVTLDNLIKQKAGIESYLQGMVDQGQRALLHTLLQPMLEASPSLNTQQKQDWQARLPNMTTERLTQLVRLLFAEKVNQKPNPTNFATLAQEIALPLPKVSANEPEMLKIPAGQFMMGCKEERDNDCEDDEKPAHPVQIAAFELGKYEVTQAQWQAVMGENPSYFQDCGDTCAVEAVSWDMVQDFIQKLNAKTGLHYRLPSEAEWEYACRAGKDSHYCGGNDVYAVAWHDANGDRHTHAVGHKQPNAWGLYDMSGNVYEWVQDWYHDSYNGAPSDGSAWEGSGTYRVLRGGSWYYYPRNSRAAFRSDNTPAGRNYSIGFRLARTLP